MVKDEKMRSPFSPLLRVNASSHQVSQVDYTPTCVDQDMASEEADDDDGLEASANETLLEVAVVRPRRTNHRPKSFTTQIIFASILAALGGVLFGYDVGIVSGALLQLKRQFSLDCFQQEMVVSSMLFGALLASFTGGFLVDHIGRRLTIIFNAVFFIIGAVILTCSPNFPTVILGRLVVGFAVSLSAIAECVYISEISPPRQRGLLVSLNELGITIGFLLAYLINLLFIKTPEGWRYMFGLSMVPALLQGLGMAFLPPSPRFLMIRQKEQEAMKVLVKLRGTDEVEEEINSIRESLADQKSTTVCDLFRSKDNMGFRMLLGLGLVFFQQFTGQPNVLYYAPTIFLSIGFGSDTAAMAATVGLGVAKVIFTSIVLFCVDYVGRRKFLLAGTLLMLVGMATLGFVTLNQPPAISYTKCEPSPPGDLSTPHPLSAGSNHTLEEAGRATRRRRDHGLPFPLQIPAANHSHSAVPGNMKTPVKWLSFLALVIFIAGYAVGFGPVSWLLLSEIFPSQIRGRAISLATVANWGTNLVVSATFLNLINALSLSGTFLLYAAVSLVSLSYIFLLVPETKGQTLEKISAHLNQGYLAADIRCCKKRSGSRLNLKDDSDVENDYESMNPNTSYSLLARR